MALAFTYPNFPGGGDKVPFGDRWMRIVSIAFDNSYPTNGEAVTFADLGVADTPDVVLCISGHKGYVFDYDAANQKMLVYYGDNNNASDGPLVEVANAADISAITGAKFLVIAKYASR